VATVAHQKDHKSNDNLDRCYKVVQQSGTKGIRAIEIKEQLGIDKTTVHRQLSRLDLRGKVESKGGRWFAKTAEQTIKPLEKEIVIELPLPKDQVAPTALMEELAHEAEQSDFTRLAGTYRIFLAKLKEARTIRITGRNVDDLDLEKTQNLILQASKKTFKIDFKGLLRSLKRSLDNEPRKQ
jgi:hypothetical protein